MPSQHLLQDQQFTRLKPLAIGGTSTIWSARQRNHRRSVVLKVAHESTPLGWSHPLWREYEALMKLRSPQVVKVIGRGRTRSGPLPQGRPYLILHRVLAPTLSLQKLSLSHLERLTRELGAAIAGLHDKGWLHRDLKPSNVLWDAAKPQPPLLIDLGLAVRLGYRPVKGHLSGSLPYISPEAILGNKLDERADLYAFGQLLWRAWVGHPPLNKACAEQWIRWHLAGHNLDPARYRPGLPSLWNWAIRTWTARRVDRRPRTFRDALKPLGLAPEQTLPPPSFWPALRHRLVRAASGFPSVVWSPDPNWPHSLDALETKLWSASKNWNTFNLSKPVHSDTWCWMFKAMRRGVLLVIAPAVRVQSDLFRRLLRSLFQPGHSGLILLYGPKPKCWPEDLKGVLCDLFDSKDCAQQTPDRGEDQSKKNL